MQAINKVFIISIIVYIQNNDSQKYFDAQMRGFIVFYFVLEHRQDVSWYQIKIVLIKDEQRCHTISCYAHLQWAKT